MNKQYRSKKGVTGLSMLLGILILIGVLTLGYYMIGKTGKSANSIADSGNCGSLVAGVNKIGTCREECRIGETKLFINPCKSKQVCCTVDAQDPNANKPYYFYVEDMKIKPKVATSTDCKQITPIELECKPHAEFIITTKIRNAGQNAVTVYAMPQREVVSGSASKTPQSIINKEGKVVIEPGDFKIITVTSKESAKGVIKFIPAAICDTAECKSYTSDDVGVYYIDPASNGYLVTVTVK